MRNFLKKGQRKPEDKAREMLTLEVSEIEEISEKLFKKIDDKIMNLKTIEKEVDKKIGILEKLLNKAENMNLPSEHMHSGRHREIAALYQKGLKVDEIASILDMPKGEVELILSLGK